MYIFISLQTSVSKMIFKPADRKTIIYIYIDIFLPSVLGLMLLFEEFISYPCMVHEIYVCILSIILVTESNRKGIIVNVYTSIDIFN